MRKLKSLFLLFFGISAGYDRDDISLPENTFDRNTLEKYGKMTFNEFHKYHTEVGQNLGSNLEEKYRVLQRECFTSGICKKRKNPNFERSRQHKNFNQWDITETCPDSVDADIWDFGTGEQNDVIIDGRTIILEASVDVGMLVIRNSGKLIFKDFGTSAASPIVLRAKSIKVFEYVGILIFLNIKLDY